MTPRFLGLAALGWVLAVAACSARDDAETPASAEDGVGTLGLSLQVGTGTVVNSFNYVITGPAGYSRPGVVNVASSSTLSALIGGIPVGSGYLVSLTTSAADGSFACTGSGAFNVAARATSNVKVHLQCREQAKTGSVLVSGDFNQCAAIDGLGASPQSVTVGSSLSLSALAHDGDSLPSALTYAWSVSSGTLSNASAKEPLFTCTSAGDVNVSLTVSDGDCGDTLTTTVSCTPAAPSGGVARVVVNEVESNGGVPGDWVELYNDGTAPADLSGWKFKDNDDSHAFFVIPAGTVLAPGAYLTLEEAQFGFGLGGADSARLYDAAGNPVDSFAWTAHAASTYGRCANGSGAFVAMTSTKGAANDCGSSGGGGSSGGSSAGGSGAGGSGGTGGSGGSGGVAVMAWPGSSDVVTIDDAAFFGTNMSGLSYQPANAGNPAVLWAVQNSPSKLYRLLSGGPGWTPDTNGWASGRSMHYLDGTGAPDCEGITKSDLTDDFMYVATERDNNNNQVSKLVILRVDTNTPSGDLVTTNEWNLTADLPAVGPNLGLEAITFVPDAALVAGGFVDATTNAAYDPATYPNHSGGVFFVGVEGTGNVHAYVLNHATNGFVRIATFSAGLQAIGTGAGTVMDLSYDRQNNYIFAYCDNTCGNKSALLRPTGGSFQVAKYFGPPAGLPNANNEGITFVPDSECSAGQRSFFWSDDDQSAGHALRRGSINCGSLL